MHVELALRVLGRHTGLRMKPKRQIKRAPRYLHGEKNIAGRFVAHRDGYGFVIPDHPLPGIQGDIFIGSRSVGGAMHGDRVLVSGLRSHDGARAEGRIERILERAQTTVVGRFHHGPAHSYVLPFDERITSQIIIPKGRELPSAATEHDASLTASKLDGSFVNVEITRFPTATQDAVGRVIEVLGREGEFGIDVEIIIRKHHLRHEFPEAVRHEATHTPRTIDPEEIARRQDFRELPIVTIDGETAKDFDDAVYVERLPNGNFQLQVHIADVSYYVHPGSALDREARLRGTSVYFPDRAVPMLPSELSTGICSLNPAEDRLVLSVLMEIDSEGAVLNASFHEGIIRSVERMTYTN